MNDLQILNWYLTAGVDEVIGEEPINRLVSSQQKQIKTQPVQNTPVIPIQITKAQNVPTNTLAEKATTLEELKDLIAQFDTPLKKNAQKMVFADGNPQANLMVIGEAPGAEEDKRGLPFVGESGHLLDAMLKSIGQDRTNTYITNVINFRPLNNRTPSLDEMYLFLPFLKKHIELIHPKVLLVLGNCAATTLTNSTEGISRLRGKWIMYNGIPMMPSFHPSFLLRDPMNKKNSWHDFLCVQQKLSSL